MMAYKHLHELLKEDQEPFDIKSFIADKKNSINGGPKTTLQLKKRKPIIENSSFYKHACFLSFHDSPDVRKSPFIGFPSPVAAKSPAKTQNGGVFFHVPARTAASLLEAAIRVQRKQQKTQIKNVGFGLFGSILKRLKDRKKSKKREIKNIKSANEVDESRRIAYEKSVFSSCNNSRVMESSSSCRSEDSLEEAFSEYEKRFYSSPLSPFRFALRKNPYPCRRTPEFSSPVASPNCQLNEEKENKEAGGLSNIHVEDDEKEQLSPVSILDNPFEDDDDDGNEDGDAIEYDDDYELDCSYAIVQRSKQQILYKLCRFEKLAELDPIELEKRMVEQIDDEDYYENQLEEEEFQDNEDDFNTSITEVLTKSSFENSGKIPADMKRLVSDLISKEKCEKNGFNDEDSVVKRVCKKLESWKEVESNTIDMMVQLDFVGDFDAWKKYPEQIGEIAMEVEHEIYELLMEELSEDLLG